MEEIFPQTKRKKKGGGIFIGSNATTTGIKGSISVYDNTARKGKDLYLSSGKKLTLTGALDNSAKFNSIDMEELGVFTDGYSTYHSNTLPSDFFNKVPGAIPAKWNDPDAGTEAMLESAWPDLQAMINDAAVNGTNSHTVTLGSNYLAGSTDSALCIPDGKTVTINLSGYTIDRNLMESKANGYVIEVKNGGKLTIKGGGHITGGYNSGNGGGIYVHEGAELHIEYGNINGNSTDGNGGGVYVDKTAKFEMTGGTIGECTATNGNGGGVYVANNAIFTMTGTTTAIAKCTATNGEGGGVYVAGGNHGNGTFTMSNGGIDDCKAIDPGDTSKGINYGHGGGVCVYGTFTFNNKLSGIKRNNATNAGDNIYVGKNGTFSRTDETIEDRAEKDYHITFYINDGSTGTEASDVQHVKLNVDGQSVSPTLKTNSFTNGTLSFNGWNTQRDGSGTAYADGATINISGDMYLYAQWIDSTEYSVTMTNDGHGSAAASPTSGTAGTTVTITATPSGGYTFKEWKVVSGGITLADTSKATTTFDIKNANVEIKALFEKKSSPAPDPEPDPSPKPTPKPAPIITDDTSSEPAPGPETVTKTNTTTTTDPSTGNTTTTTTTVTKTENGTIETQTKTVTDSSGNVISETKTETVTDNKAGTVTVTAETKDYQAGTVTKEQSVTDIKTGASEGTSVTSTFDGTVTGITASSTTADGATTKTIYIPVKTETDKLTLTAVTVTGTGEVTIPSSFKAADGKTYTVTGIGPRAFKGDTSIVNVTIPSTITEIGQGAFNSATSVQSITIYVEKAKNLKVMKNAVKGLKKGRKVNIHCKNKKQFEKIKTKFKSAGGKNLKYIFQKLN